MYTGAVLVLSYFSYVFITERLSLLPPPRFHFAKHNGARTRKRYLGYWSALSVLVSGFGSAIVLANTTLQKLVFVTCAFYCCLMLPAFVLYWIVEKRAANRTFDHYSHRLHYSGPDSHTKELPMRKIQIDYEL